MTVNSYSESEDSKVYSETMGQEESSTKFNAHMEDVAIKNVEAPAEDKKSSELCTSAAKDKQNYAEDNVILRKALKRYEDALNSARKETAIKNIKVLLADKTSSDIFTSKAKDEQNYAEENVILRKALKKYDDIFDSVIKEADTELATVSSVLESCQRNYREIEQTLAQCQNNFYSAAVKIIETELPNEDNYYSTINLEYVIRDLSAAKVNLDYAKREHKIFQDQFAFVESRYNSAKSRCDSGEFLTKTRASIESMLSFSGVNTNTN